MEEWVGALWDRWITKAANQTYPEAAVTLESVQRRIGLLFRALGGDTGVQLQAATQQQHGARRRWLARIAGSALHTELVGFDTRFFRLPARIALFPSKDLNTDIYLWLAALAAHDVPNNEPFWIRNQRATLVTLDRCPALKPRYERLVAACLSLRIPPDSLPPDEAAQEIAIRQMLQHPGSCLSLPPLTRHQAKPVQPIPLWLNSLNPMGHTTRKPQHQESAAETSSEAVCQPKQAAQTEAPESEHGMLLLFRAESLFSWAEYVKVNRSQDDDPDPQAGAAADTLDTLSVMQDGQRVASRVRLELDLPAAEEDDIPLGAGIHLPEWDYRKQHYRADYCCLQPMLAREATPGHLPEHLRSQMRRLRSQFAALAPARRWLNAQTEGSELDLEAWVRYQGDRYAGHELARAAFYRAQIPQERDLACLVLADLSLSTDASANNHQKVIDVIRDTLMLFGEALSTTGDRFALCGFSSLRRDHVRYHALKSFDATYDAQACGRIAALRPGYYTRLGAAIRYSTQQLIAQPCRQKLLLILSDGKPHDLDLYEGRYGIEDTRQSVLEAHAQGVQPFCVTIDREGASYLPHMFGHTGFVLLRRADELSQRLPMLYAQLTSL